MEVEPPTRVPRPAGRHQLPLPASHAEKAPPPLLKNMEAICPISTRSVISKRFDPRLSVEPRGKKGCYSFPQGQAPRRAAGFTESSRIKKSQGAQTLKKTFPCVSCLKHFKKHPQRRLPGSQDFECPSHGSGVRSLVGQRRCHMPRSAAKKNKYIDKGKEKMSIERDPGMLTVG